MLNSLPVTAYRLPTIAVAMSTQNRRQSVDLFLQGVEFIA